MPDETHPTQPVVPTQAQHELPPIGNADGPIVYFDIAPNFGFNDGIGNVTLEAARYISTSQNVVVTDRVVVAHLRMGLSAAMNLRAALDGDDPYGLAQA